MIVMKFGGSSLASPASFTSVVSIIQSQIDRHPVIVASAMGDTTDDLLRILSHARRADSYAALKLQDQVKTRHFAVCEELLHGDQLEQADHFMRETFRDLHVRMLELAEGELTFTPELQDWTASIGEQLSSRLLAAVLDECCGPTVHLDARKLILTDDRFTNAQPLYWETYARIRWAIPGSTGDSVHVLGGFIGSTNRGCTTTLGRGGSDLTASISGAALNAEEIQVWKDVDGMLTCDPRLLSGGHQVRFLSYEEATDLARAGATTLHPETMNPARRLRIPLVIRNTFCPQQPGTRIEHRFVNACKGPKSIAIRKDVTLLEVRSDDYAENPAALTQLCSRAGSGASFLCSRGHTSYIACEENSCVSEETVAASPCVEVRVRSHQAIVTLVGDGIDHERIAAQLASALHDTEFFLIPGEAGSGSLRLSVPKNVLESAVRRLHEAFFANPDPMAFILATTRAQKAEVTPDQVRHAAKQSRRFAAIPALVQSN